MSKKTLVIAISMLLVAGLVYVVAPKAGAVAPSDYGLTEGNTISAAGSSDPDVYIVNSWGYKRLFLNPVIFGFYGHLGGFAKVKTVSPATRDAFVTSGLFQLVGNPKVYGVETTGEDTGVLHWVNTTGAQAVADDPNFFKKVFVINQNEFNWYTKSSTDYTSVSQVPNYSRVAGVTPTPTPGAVNVSLASDNPGASTLTTKANGVTYMKIALSGNGTVSSVRVVRQGPGSTSDFSNVYLYDGARRLTTGRIPSSSDGSVTYSNLNFQVNGSAVLSVVADMSSSGATAGDVNYFSIPSGSIVLSSGTVGGSFPLNSSNFTVSGQVGGTITIDKSGSLTNPNVGQTGAQVAEFKLTANTEGAKISRVQLIHGGTMKNADITNLKLKVSGSVIATGSMTSNGYAVFDLSSSPYVIAKGDNRIFQVFADLAGKKAETINFYVEVTSDILAIGDQFGFGMSITNGTYTVGSSSTGPTSLILQGGVLTLSYVGPSATNVTTTQTKVHLLDFDLNSAANVDIRKTSIILCNDYEATGAFVSPVTASLAAGFADLNNVQIINRDTGTAYVGPQDGSTFTTVSSATTIGGGADACGSSLNGFGKLFTDSFSMTAGETKHLAIVADVKQANTGNYIKSGTIFKALLGSYSTLVGTAGDLTVLKYSDSNTGPYSTDIVPTGNLSGNSMTVQGAGLTLALAANPTTGNRNFVKGTTNVNVNGISFTAALGNAVTINSVTLQGYAGASSTATATTGNPGTLISAVRIVDGDTGAVISSSASSNNLSLASGTGSGQVKFSGLNWVIPAGATKTLTVQVDLSNNTPATTLDTLAFDLLATTDVTAVDANSNTVTANNALVNVTTGTTATTYVTVTSAGTLAVTAAPDTQISAPVYWGMNNAPFSKFHFVSTNEAFNIERLNLVGSGTTVATNVDNVIVSYPTKSSGTQTVTGTFNSAGSVSFGFADSLRPYVPKDGAMDVTVTANIKPGSGGFRANTNFAIQFSGTTADEFRAVGDGSGAVITGASTGLSSVTTATTTSVKAQYVYRAYPTFTLVSTPATNLFAGQDIARFTIRANGNTGDSVFFDGTTAAASGSLAFAVTASGEVGNSLTLELRRADNNLLLSTASALTSQAGVAASESFTINQNGGLNITAGQSVDVVARISAISGYAKPAATGRAADYVQMTMKTNVPGLQTWTDNSGTDRKSNVSSIANILPTLPMTFSAVQLK